MSGGRAPTAVRGTAHHGSVLGAAGLAVLLAATVLAALAALTEKAVEDGTQRRLARDPTAVVEVSGAYRSRDADRIDGLVRAAMDRAYGGVPHRTAPHRIWSASRVPASRSSALSVTETDGRRRDDALVTLVALRGGAAARRAGGRALPRAACGPGGGGAEEYTVLDRAGRLQLPRDYVNRYGPRGRVRLTAEQDHAGVWPDGDGPGPSTDDEPLAGTDGGR